MIYKKTTNSIILTLVLTLAITLIVPTVNADTVSAAGKVYTDQEKREYIETWIYQNVDSKKEGIKKVNDYYDEYKQVVALNGMMAKIDQLNGSNFNQKEKAKEIHDWICSTLTYDYSYEIRDWYDAIVQGKGVCEAYTDLFHIMASFVDIPNIQVRGRLPEAGNGSHRINAVYIDNEWTYIDVTNDDGTIISSDLFMISPVDATYFVPYAVLAYGNGYYENIFDWDNGHLSPQKTKVIISFNKIRGTMSGVKNEQIVGEKYKLPKVVAKGHSFKGWYTKTSRKGVKITSSTTITNKSKHTLYAYWNANRYRIKFNVNKGKKLKKWKKSVVYEKKYGALPKPKRSGYTFKGWYSKKNGGKKIKKNSVVKITKNTTLYARWKKK